MNGWLLVRIAGIVVGIATLLRVATNEKLVTYDPLFLAWMDRLRDIVELGFLTDLIGPFLHWGIEQVRNFGISVPELQDEWRPAFVFSMLFFAAIGRNYRSEFLLAAAPVGALIIAVWSGMNGNINPAAVVIAFSAATAAATRFAGFAAATAYLAVLIAFAVGGIVGGASVGAAFGAGGATIIQLLAGIAESWGKGLRALFDNTNFNIGLDILFTMSAAFVIAVAAANPPIW